MGAYRLGLDATPKPNAVRAIDVALIGPAMIAAAFWPAALPMLLRAILGVSGLLTITYNWQRITP